MLCILNGEEVELPDDLIQSESVFKSVVSQETWEALSESEKKQLLTFLPDCEESEENIKALFSGDDHFIFGNPISLAYEKLKDGLLLSSVMKLGEKCRKLKYKNYKMKQKEYYKNLLQQIIVSRQIVLDKIYKSGPDVNIPKQIPRREGIKSNHGQVDKKYKKILKDIALECGDGDVSSEDECDDELAPDGKGLVPQNDMITDDEFHLLFKEHRYRRCLKEHHPELDTTNISIADVILRNSVTKKPVKSKKKKSKFKSSSASVSKQPSSSKPSVSLPVKEKKADVKKTNSKESQKLKSDKKSKEEGSKSKPSKSYGFPKMACFFSLLGYFFENEQEKKCSKSKLQEELALWQTNKSSELCGWKTLYSNWLPLLKYAIDYLVGKGSGQQLQEFIPYLIPEGEDEWIWTGPEYSNDDVILPLCNHWLETLSKVLTTKKSDDTHKKDSSKSTNVVPRSSAQERDEFRQQEKERYLNAHKPYTYKATKTDGSIFESVVGPVKGVFNVSDTTTFKAREHTMLISDRPAYVTILCLVRDAVARLPKGEGTRVDVCTLLRDSQFLNQEVSDNQIHGVVSGALDRLHAEKDPCVKFDGIRKVWIYLHKSRTFEEFVKIHEACAAAALAKKQLSKKAQKKKASLEASKEETGKNAPAKKKVKLAEAFPQVETSVVDSKHTGTVLSTTPTKPDAEKKKPNKRRRPNTETPSAPSSETPLKQQKLVEETPTDAQISLENEALMATQSILDDDDTNDFLMETTFVSDHLTSIANEIIAETSFDSFKPTRQIVNESFEENNQKLAKTSPVTDKTSLPKVPTTSILTIPVTMATPSSTPKTLLNVQNIVTTTPKNALKVQDTSNLNKNILQPGTAKHVSFPSLFLKTSNTTSPASFILKTNPTSNAKLKAGSGVQNAKFLTQQQLISNAIILQQQQQLLQKQRKQQQSQQKIQLSQPSQQQKQPKIQVSQPQQQQQQQSVNSLSTTQQILQLHQKQRLQQPIQQTNKQQNPVEQQQQQQQQQPQQIIQPLQHVLKNQQQTITQPQQQVRPQFLISTKALHGKQSLASLQQLINKNKTATISPTQGKQETVLKVKQHKTSTVKPMQTAQLGLTLGNLSSTSLQNINQLISSTKRNLNNTSKQGAVVSSVSLVNTTIALTLNKPAQPSGVSVKRSVPVNLTAGNNDLQNNLWSPNQQTPTNIVQQFVPISSTKQLTQVKQVEKKQPFTVTVTTKATNHSSSVQTLSLNQLMAAARANLQTAGIRPVNVPTTLAGQINVQKVRTNANGPTLQALLHVVPKSTTGGTPNSAQLLIQPQLTVSTGNMPKVVRLSSDAIITRPNTGTVTLQRQTLAGQTKSPVATVPLKTRNIVAPLKISLPRTAFPSNVTVRMPMNTVGSPLNKTPTSIVFSSPNMIITGQNTRPVTPKENTEKN